MDKVFLNGDVLLDHLLDRKPFSKAITVILSLGDLKQIEWVGFQIQKITRPFSWSGFTN